MSIFITADVLEFCFFAVSKKWCRRYHMQTNLESAASFLSEHSAGLVLRIKINCKSYIESYQIPAGNSLQELKRIINVPMYSASEYD